jgi:hypothetical protein
MIMLPQFLVGIYLFKLITHFSLLVAHLKKPGLLGGGVGCRRQ